MTKMLNGLIQKGLYIKPYLVKCLTLVPFVKWQCSCIICHDIFNFCSHVDDGEKMLSSRFRDIPPTFIVKKCCRSRLCDVSSITLYRQIRIRKDIIHQKTIILCLKVFVVAQFCIIDSWYSHTWKKVKFKIYLKEKTFNKKKLISCHNSHLFRYSYFRSVVTTIPKNI